MKILLRGEVDCWNGMEREGNCSKPDSTSDSHGVALGIFPFWEGRVGTVALAFHLGALSASGVNLIWIYYRWIAGLVHGIPCTVKMREVLKCMQQKEVCNHQLPGSHSLLPCCISFRIQKVGCRNSSTKAGKIPGTYTEVRILCQAKISLESIHMGELDPRMWKVGLAGSWWMYSWCCRQLSWVVEVVSAA